jgi:hypothetical protein
MACGYHRSRSVSVFLDRAMPKPRGRRARFEHIEFVPQKSWNSEMYQDAGVDSGERNDGGEENELRLRADNEDRRKLAGLPEGSWPHKAGSYGPTVTSGPLVPVARWLEKHEMVFTQYLQHCRYTSLDMTYPFRMYSLSNASCALGHSVMRKSKRIHLCKPLTHASTSAHVLASFLAMHTTSFWRIKGQACHFARYSSKPPLM